MDTDLFQTLAIVLLSVIAVLLLLAYTALARLHKILDERTSAWSQTGRQEDSARPSPSLEKRAEPTAGEPEPVGLGAAPEEAQAAPVAAESVRAEPDEVEAASPATVDEARASALAGTGPEEAAAVPADETRASEEPEGARAEDPAAVSATARETAALETSEEATAPEPEQEEPAADREAGGYEDEPQEQPFERDGRWWFRRGDELLVYDEQTGQWMPAPTSRAGVTLGSDDGDAAGGTGATATAPGDEQPSGRSGEWTSQETSGGFWKCPSCGAVNGSTATSCRMCFTPRPEGARSP